MEERNDLIKELFELHRLLADKGEIGIGYGFSKNYNRLEKQVKTLTIIDFGCSLPNKEAMYLKELEEYNEEKFWDDRVNRCDFAKGFISCYKWITNQEFKVR